jgi:hypothetical protein
MIMRLVPAGAEWYIVHKFINRDDIMEHQLSLFPSADSSKSAGLFLPRDSNALDEMFAASHRFRSGSEYMDLLRFISRFPKYSPFNGLLLYVQNPDITYVGTAGTWKRRYQRNIKYNARPLLILAPMSPVRFVFDLADTEGEPVLIDQSLQKKDFRQLSTDTLGHTIHNCALSGIIVREVELAPQTSSNLIPVTGDSFQKYEALEIEPHMNFLILLNESLDLECKYAGLVVELSKVFCGHFGISANAWWQDRKDISPKISDIEAESVAFLVCQRKSLDECTNGFLTPCRKPGENIPIVGLSAVFNATSYIEDMGRSRWKKPKKQGRN